MNETSGCFFALFGRPSGSKGGPRQQPGLTPVHNTKLWQMISQHFIRTQKIKRSHAEKKGYLFQHACLQTFIEPWGENELQIKMSIWCIILIGTDGKRELCSALILQPKGTDLRSCHYQLSPPWWACWEVDSPRLSAVLTGVFAG